MEDISVFLDKSVEPTDKDLSGKLGSAYARWKHIYDLVLEKYPDGQPEWNFPGKKYGWSFRIKDKKRAIIYLLPRDGYFKVAFVFGDKAVNEVMESPVNKDIKTTLNEARKYAEGRGIRIDVKDDSILEDIGLLIGIKLKY